MKIKKEKSVSAFNRDVSLKGRYLYTTEEAYSLRVSRERQVKEIIDTILENYKRRLKVLDIGCGDGTFALILIKAISPKYILGFDPAKKGVESAKKRLPKKYSGKIEFQNFSIYDADSKIKKDFFDIGVAWGVFHHLYYPQKAIKKISKVLDEIIILEPNGFNPFLKIIEKTSKYHKEHEEKSYWPPTFRSWFKNNGYILKKESFHCLVPYFCNEKIAKILKMIEPFIEKTPIINKFFCGAVLFYFVKEN
ncbi:MAG: hypothetical protein A2W22_00255 [Candidatus Levybacteria bacterium RBG_16_35_11]|nr:MAG: hypothetical protein A2W22_00255 [Candidatus Levybacteria bacterium RBG_16_35_11]